MSYQGYSGGNIENPTYEQVCSNQTGHRKQFKLLIIQILRHLKIFWMFTLNYLTRQIIKELF